MKGKALRRALDTDPLRVNANLPLIVTTTEMVSPDLAKQWLKTNRNNRPVNWRKVDEYAAMMIGGRWRLHDQGIMFDTTGNLLTGQTRLWAIVKSDLNMYLRVSRGNPVESAALIDRGVPQSARDLAARASGRAHSPTEASIARAIAALTGELKPSKDELAVILADHAQTIGELMAGTKGQRKSKQLLMILAALIVEDGTHAVSRLTEVPILVDRLCVDLLPRTAAECWGRGAAFSLALEMARRLVR